MTLERDERHGQAMRFLAPLVARHRPLASSRVVEFGCGSGPVSEAFARHGASVLGLEILAEEVATGRRRLAAEPDLDVELFAGGWPELLARLERETGSVDVVLFPAVLEHMTIAERLEGLRAAARALRPGGVVALFETPNRLLPMDHHTSLTPFFHLLPDDLALEWFERISRQDIADELRAVPEGPARRVALARQGRGVSFHEFDVAWPAGWSVLDGGYDPLLAPIRLVHREERALWMLAQQRGYAMHPAFSRYWIDLVVRPGADGPMPADGVVAGQWQPVALEAVDTPGAGITRWETLVFTRPGATVGLEPGYEFDGVVVGMETARDAELHLDVIAGEDERSIVAPAQTATHYTALDLPARAGRLTLRAVTGNIHVSHVAVRAAGMRA